MEMDFFLFSLLEVYEVLKRFADKERNFIMWFFFDEKIDATDANESESQKRNSESKSK